MGPTRQDLGPQNFPFKTTILFALYQFYAKLSGEHYRLLEGSAFCWCKFEKGELIYNYHILYVNREVYIVTAFYLLKIDNILPCSDIFYLDLSLMFLKLTL